ncbi:MAG TPA: hypothetical protein VFD39_14565 [Trueperaceae bacterium]|nr:hypothetical protein [Trueperaceae bacterium]
MIARCCLLLLICIGLGHAAALDRARYEEMVEQIEEVVEEGEERNAFVDAVGDYIEQRDDALLELVEFIKETEGDQEGEWRSVLSGISGIPVLADVDDDLTSEAALDLYDQFIDEEQEWVSALSVLETAAYRDDLVNLRIRLANMTVQLDEKWNGLLNDDGQLDERQLRVMADIYGILAQLARDSDTKRQTVRNSLQVVTDLLTRVDVVSGVVPGEVASAITQALGIIAESTKQYNTYVTAVEALRPRLRELSGQELGLLVIFNETRADTQLFVNENSYDIMKELYDEAEGELEGFEGVGTSGQQDDAEVFVGLLIDPLEDRLAEGGNIFNAFVAKHNLKFFGPVGPDISEFLVDTKVWLAEAERVSDLDLQRVLSSWRSDANSFFGVSLSGDGITDYEREFIEDALSSDLEDLQEAIDEAGAAFSTENLLLIHDRREVAEAIE